MVFDLKYFGVTAMEYAYSLPLLEVLVINLITLDHCFKRKYSGFKTILAFCAFTVFCIFSLVFCNREIFTGDGTYLIFGFIYIIPLKILYGEKFERLLLNMCMCWTYTIGIFSISIQMVHYLEFLNYDIAVIMIETVLFLLTFIPFRKYVIPKYTYIFQNIYDFQKRQFRCLEVSVYFNFLVLDILHLVFLDSEKYLLQIAVFIIILAANYLFYSIVYEVINSTVKIDELEKTVTIDALTRLGNRVQMIRDMRVLMEENKIFSVMFLDLDRFKLINDQHGHVTGDRYLVHFGKVCSGEMKERGKLYRYGGDEFVAIYYGALTEEMADSIARCKNWDDGAPCEFNQVSVGFVVCRPPYNVKDPEVIVKQADGIMYRNKLKKKRPYQGKS